MQNPTDTSLIHLDSYLDCIYSGELTIGGKIKNMNPLAENTLRSYDEVMKEVEAFRESGNKDEAVTTLSIPTQIAWYLDECILWFSIQKPHIWIQHSEDNPKLDGVVEAIVTAARSSNPNISDLIRWSLQTTKAKDSETEDADYERMATLWSNAASDAEAFERDVVERWSEDVSVDALPIPEPFAQNEDFLAVYGKTSEQSPTKLAQKLGRTEIPFPSLILIDSKEIAAWNELVKPEYKTGYPDSSSGTSASPTEQIMNLLRLDPDILLIPDELVTSETEKTLTDMSLIIFPRILIIGRDTETAKKISETATTANIPVIDAPSILNA